MTDWHEGLQRNAAEAQAVAELLARRAKQLDVDEFEKQMQQREEEELKKFENLTKRKVILIRIETPKAVAATA